MTLKKCQDCKTEYHDQDAIRFGHCPNCDSEFFTLVSLKEVATTTTKKNPAKNSRSGNPFHSATSSSQSDQVAEVSEIEKLIATQNKNTLDLIQAQNKTTHAVRAFVRFLFIQLSGLTLVFFTWNLSLMSVDPNECARFGEKCEGNLFLQFLSIGIWIGTVILSSRAGWSELEKSDVY
jgi:hypothetical protein